MRLQLESTVGQSALSQATGPEAGASGNSSSRSTASGQDRVQISGPAGIVSQLSATRASRLEQIAAAVQNGSYQVSSASVSKAIVDHAIA